MLMRIAVRLGIVAVVVVGGFLFRDYLKGNANELRAGDCFDEPAGVTDTIDDVQHHPCTEAHHYEAILVTTHPAAKGAPYPSELEIDAWVGQQCVPAFTSYTGLGLDSQEVVGLSYYRPTEDAWKDGNRKIICYVGRTDGTTVSQSFRTAGG